MDIPVKDSQTYFDYLDNLRESGEVNMFGAGRYLEKEFSLSSDKARQILLQWMKDFTQRHS